MSEPVSNVNFGKSVEFVTLSASQDHTMDEFPIPRVPFFLRLRESISSTCQVLNFASMTGSRIV